MAFPQKYVKLVLNTTIPVKIKCGQSRCKRVSKLEQSFHFSFVLYSTSQFLCFILLCLLSSSRMKFQHYIVLFFYFKLIFCRLVKIQNFVLLSMSIACNIMLSNTKVGSSRRPSIENRKSADKVGNIGRIAWISVI